ncbi:MAG: PASTA domain-containing protein [Clostridia bacterium]|nr:PASTA domain-containing protein [Clostridia bacterium]
MPWLIAFLAVVFLLLIARIFHLQVSSRGWYLKKAQGQWRRTTAIAASRGTIVDANGVELAANISAYKIVIWPQSAKSAEKPRIASELASLLGVDEANLISRLNSERISEYVVKRGVDKETADAVTALQLGRGVGILPDVKRYYPYHSLLSQTLGFTTVDNVGQSGLELTLDKYLTGREGKYIAETDRTGALLPDSAIEYIEPEDGCKVRLTVDSYFQSYLESALEEAVSVNNASNAQGIILDVTDGAIKAISTKPDLDLNAPPRSDLEKLAELSKNRVVTDAYEPGSTFKILTLAAALDSGSTTLSSNFYCNGGYIVGSERIKCWRHAGHGSQNLTEATENSCNVCFMQLALSMGCETFYDYLYAFGLGQSTGSGLPGEGSGIVTNGKYVKENDLARIGFGQSIAVTPIQLAAAVAAAVNGGELHTPYIVDQVISNDGKVVYEMDTAPVRRVISEETSLKLRKILQSVVDNGTGRNAKIEGYAVGGKTGTAQKYDKYGRVSVGSYICSFIGFAPADEPRYLCLILVDEPHVSSIFGSTVAAPYVRRVLSDVLTHARIPKTDFNTTTVEIPNLVGLEMQEALDKLSELGLYGLHETDEHVTVQVPAAGQLVPYGSSVLLYTGREGMNEEPDSPYMVEMPNLIGMSPIQAYDALKALGLKMQSEPADPYGEVYAQSVYAHQQVEFGSTVTVYFRSDNPILTLAPTAAPTEQPTEDPTEAPTGEPSETDAPYGPPSPAQP